MTPAETVVSAAVVGALAVLVSALIAAGVAFRNENRRRAAARRDAGTQAVRAQAAEVFRCMFLLQHEMEWLTWHAVERPKDVTAELTAAYESAVHAGYPRLLGAMAVLASLDLNTYNELLPLVDRIYDAEGEIAVLITGLAGRRTRAGSLLGLGNLFKSISELYKELPPEMASAMERVAN